MPLRGSRPHHARATRLPTLTLRVPSRRRDIEKKGLDEFEVAQIGNLLPDTADEAKALEPAPMTAAEAHAAAAAEGLVLVRTENTTGFKGVYLSGTVRKPFKAMAWHVKHGGRTKTLGPLVDELAVSAAAHLEHRI